MRSIVGFLTFLVVITQPSWAQNSNDLCAHPHASAGWKRRVGAWIANVDSDFFDSRANISRKLAALKELGVTEIYPVVWNKGALLFQAPDLQAQWGDSPYFDTRWRGRDLLKEVIDEARPLGLKVYPWFESGLKVPDEMEVRKKHPTWFLKNLRGSFHDVEGGKELARLNPAHPEVKRLFADMFRRVAEKYAVDGIQFDDHFGYAREWGYDEATLSAYKRDTGLSPPRNVPAPNTPASSPLLKPWRPWMQWKGERLTEFIGVVAEGVRAAKGPDFKIQVAPHPHPWSLNMLGQNWPEWIKRGWVDEVIAQVYREGDSNYSFELRNPGFVAAKKCVPILVGVYAGQKNRVMPTDKVTWQIGIARDFAFEGVAFFNAETVFNGKDDETDRVSKLKEALSH